MEKNTEYLILGITALIGSVIIAAFIEDKQLLYLQCSLYLAIIAATAIGKYQRKGE